MKTRTLATTCVLAMTMASFGCANDAPTTVAKATPIAQRTSKPTSKLSASSPSAAFLRRRAATKRATTKPQPLASASDAGVSIPAKYQAFATAFELQRQSYGAPGAAVAILEHGQVTFAHGFGAAGPASTQPVDADTIFRVGTTTEAFTAAAELSLVDHGKASLHESITTLVPNVALKGPNARSLTLKDLMSSQSGLYDFTNLSSDPTLATFTCATGDSTLNSFVTGPVFGNIQNEFFMNAPGQFYTLSDPNFILTGAAIEQQSGAFFPTAMKNVLFAPLGMTRTFFLPSDVESAGNYSDGSSTNPDGSPWDVTPDAYDCAAYRPYGYAFTSASDYAKFVQLLLVGNPAILSDASRVAMQSAQVSTKALGEIVSEGFGLTVQTGYVSPSNAYYPTKTVSSFGSIPGFTSELFLIPETGFGIVVLSNGDGQPYDDAIDVAVQSFAGLPPAAPLPPSTNAVPSKLASYAGTYADPTGYVGTIVVSDVGGALSVAFSDAATLGFTYWPQVTPVFRDSFLIAIEGFPYQVSFIPNKAGQYDHLLLFDAVPAARVPASTP